MEDEGECPVCYERLRERIAAELPCAHTFCLACLMRLPAPQLCPLCRSTIGHLIPQPCRTASSTVVTLNVSAETTEANLTERVRIAEHLATAIRRLGAAPRNASPYAIVPFDERGALPHGVDGVVDAGRVVPAADEDDGAAVPAA